MFLAIHTSATAVSAFSDEVLAPTIASFPALLEDSYMT